jgi:alkanesulfonate monooxygenase SsuD/methylene tetrahydromethanopterin reductase-like flavin-dependent oxidoreductase (luciferase family)
VSLADMGLQLGRIGAWFNPRYDDNTRTEFVVQAESLGYPTAWLGFGRASISDLTLVERVLDATATITVATAIVNMWTNDPLEITKAYQRIASRHADRFLYLVVPDHTRHARQLLGPNVVIAPEHKVVLETDPDIARRIGRPFVADPYLKLRNYTNNIRRYGYTEDDIADGGSDRLIDDLVLRGSTDTIAAGLQAHLDAGADHVAIQVLTPGDDDPMPGYRLMAHALL